MHDPHPIEDLLTRDIQLPYLRTAINAGTVAAFLGLREDSLRLDYLRYKPGTNCLARYQTQDPRQPYVYFKTFAADSQIKATNAFDKAADATNQPLQFNQTSVVYRFPGDAKLRSLGRLHASPNWLDKRFALPSEQLQREVLAYKPERRCVMRLQHGETRYVLKLFTGRSFHKACCAALRQQQLPLAAPAVVKKVQRHAALLLEHIDGPTLRQEISAGHGALGCIIAGRMLARLHDTVIADLPPRPLTAADHGLLYWLLPETAGQVRDIVGTATDRIRNTAASWVTIHGDYYDKQIIMGQDGHPVLVDLDDLGQGDHRLDLANFIAHLEAVRPEDAATLTDLFLSAYTSSSRNGTDALGAYVALATLQLAHHGFRSGQPDWPARIQTSIDRAQSWLDNQGAH